MEGMAMGLPCVVSNIRGNIDLIKDGEGGFLCETNNPRDYADKLNLLAKSEELRFKMGAINKEEIKKYNIDSICSRMLEIYKDVLRN
jgi:glycosyltransferase involved in cell wall biosynthesis